MYKSNKILCVIPARGGSKGLPGKNIKELAGKPLIGHTIEQAKQSLYIDKLIVSTDDNKISEISKLFGAEVPFVRPAYIASDHATILDVLLHAVDWIEENEKNKFDILMYLHVTAPLRKVSDIDNCIKLLVESKADNVFSVTEAHRNPYFNMIEINKRGTIKLVKKGNFSTRQLAPKVYDLNASIYVWWKDIFKKKKKLILRNTRIYMMPKERSIDIDDDLDFRIANFLLENRK